MKHLQDKRWEIRASGKDAQGRCIYVAVIERRVGIVRYFLKKNTENATQKDTGRPGKGWED